MKNISGTLRGHAPSYLILYCMIKDSKAIKPRDLLFLISNYCPSQVHLVSLLSSCQWGEWVRELAGCLRRLEQAL